MKKALWVFLLMCILCGCGIAPADPTESVPLVQEPTIPWIYENGTQWDDAGSLLEVPVIIPDGTFYANSIEFDGDILFWNTDAHRLDSTVLELALFDLDTGVCTAQREYPMTNYPTPQVLGDAVFLCDNTGGFILQLDKTLDVVNRWDLQPEEGTWYMGSGGKLYQYKDYTSLWVYDLEDGSAKPVIAENPEITAFAEEGGALSFEYYRAHTGERGPTFLNLQTGELVNPNIHSVYGYATYCGNRWMSTTYLDGYVHCLQMDDDTLVRIETGDTMLSILPDERLLLTAEDGTSLYLYDLQGNPISGCCICETGNYFALDPIWCESLNGYFLRVEGLSADRRLLFWSATEAIPDAPTLNMEPISPPTDAQLALSQRAQELGEKYGLTILVGDECEERFSEFTATAVTDYQTVSYALDTLDAALAVYPTGFLAQLKNEAFRGIQIQLVSNLIADGGGREGDGYAAFTEQMGNYYLMVVDIDDTNETTYYHEFSHIIDSFLEFDSYQREDALFSEAAWASHNPDWFAGYTYDYGVEQEVQDFGYFIDTSSTINPTEDRARVMEYAMSSYGDWMFDNSRGLLDKLDYYSRCIRQVFDTTGWPETVIWEQYLNQK